MSRRPVELAVPATKYDWSKVDGWADNEVMKKYYELWDSLGCAEECHNAEQVFEIALLFAEALAAQVAEGTERGWDD